MRRARVSALAVVFSLAIAHVAGAHPLAPSLLDVREVDGGQIEVTWKIPRLRALGSDPKPVLPTPCRDATKPFVDGDDTSVRRHWVADCGGAPLIGSEFRIDDLPESATVVVRVTLHDGRTVQSLVSSRQPGFVVPPQPDRWVVARAYVSLGIEHILSGMDHLLFVFGLLLLTRTQRSLVETITAFTVGHSITLSLVVLDLIAPPPGPTELAIALTVLALAIELAREPAGTTLLRRYPWLMSLVFGLLHGLGFAAAMQRAGLPHGEIPLALASFNLGIEAGQLAFVATVMVARHLLSSFTPFVSAWMARVPVYTMGSLAAFWTFQRTAALLR